MSVLGRPAMLEVDVNFVLRCPLWEPVQSDSGQFIGVRAGAVPVLDLHELAAGKLAALLSRGASRDLFDVRELLGNQLLDQDKLRLAFVVYGGISRVDWRVVSTDRVNTTVEDVTRKLLPMLRQEIQPAADAVESWTTTLVDQTRELLAAVLPLTDAELAFLDHLNDDGEIVPDLLTQDPSLQDRIKSNPGLQWKALNVKKHRRSSD